MPAKKSMEPKATSERITLKGEKRARVVYVGPKGGKYVRMDGKYVSLKSLPKSGKTSSKRMQKGGYIFTDKMKNELRDSDFSKLTTFKRVESESALKKLRESGYPVETVFPGKISISGAGIFGIDPERGNISSIQNITYDDLIKQLETLATSKGL